jgi:asparagine synthase (glutamine-hydrolysing)
MLNYIGRISKQGRRNPGFENAFSGSAISIHAGDLSLIQLEQQTDEWLMLEHQGKPCLLYIDGTIILDGAAITNASNKEVKRERVLTALLSNADRFLQSAEGHFVLLLWDEANRRYLIARDKTGMKNLFYAENEEALYFSSSISNLLKYTEVNQSINRESLYRYIYDHPVAGQETIYQFIHRLEFGSYLSSSSQGDSLQKRYYEIKPARDFKEESFREDFKDLLIESVRQSTLGKDEVGIALSGGLDSTSIAAVLGKHLDKRVIGTSYIFKKNEMEDEEAYIDLITGKTGIDLIKIDGREHWTFQGDIEGTIANLDEPYPVFNYHFTSYAPSLIKDRTNLFLSGLYGDQVLYGNMNYLKGFVKRGEFFTLLKEIESWKGIYSKKEIFIDFLKSRRVSQDVMPEWINRKVVPESSRHSSEQLNYTWDEEDNVKYYMNLLKQSSKDWTVPSVYYPNKVDIKFPFLHTRLLEYLAAAPASLKLNPKYNKYILRESLKKELPDEIRNRKGKSTHFSFIHNGFKKEMKQLKNVYDFEILSDLGILDPKPVKKIIDHYYLGHFDDFKYFSLILRLISLEIWLKPRKALLS